MTSKPLDLSQFEGHTPRPWDVRFSWIVGEDGEDVITTIPYAELEFGSEADEALIAAAPDLLAELKELRLATTWQPIETAPKDGTRVLAYHQTELVFSSEFLDGEWTGDHERPTHWMPLPQPPEDE